MTDEEFEALVILADAFKRAQKLSPNNGRRVASIMYSWKVENERERRIQEARDSK